MEKLKNIFIKFLNWSRVVFRCSRPSLDQVRGSTRTHTKTHLLLSFGGQLYISEQTFAGARTAMKELFVILQKHRRIIKLILKKSFLKLKGVSWTFSSLKLIVQQGKFYGFLLIFPTCILKIANQWDQLIVNYCRL